MKTTNVMRLLKEGEPLRPAWSEYHAASRYYRGSLVLMDQERIEDLKSQGLDYQFAEDVPLISETSTIDEVALGKVLQGRQSTRAFNGRPVSKQIVDAVVSRSFILSTSLHGTEPRRPTPSAGALYPVELYLISVLGEDFPPCGLLHLAAHPKRPTKNWALLPHRVPIEALNDTLYSPIPVGTAGVFVLSAIINKATAKYGERGYRFCLIEIGHVAQNLLIALQAAGLGSLCIGGFADSALNRLLGLDGFNEAVLYAI
jgi:SagB-type dehydrogenase family enzyme